MMDVTSIKDKPQVNILRLIVFSCHFMATTTIITIVMNMMTATIKFTIAITAIAMEIVPPE